MLLSKPCNCYYQGKNKIMPKAQPFQYTYFITTYTFTLTDGFISNFCDLNLMTLSLKIYSICREQLNIQPNISVSGSH